MLYTDKLEIMANKKPMQNPLPFFQEQQRNVQVPMEDSVLEEDKVLLGYESAGRFLPYKMQDRYSRKRELSNIKTVILENEYLKAVFLPEYGGRLYSLYHKKLQKDLVFKNPVLQTANLAILDAWIAGGIEWNIGQTGHTFTTCDSVFMCKMQNENGNDFIRMFEYERCHEIFWQIDFHLPEKSDMLIAYVRIINDAEEEKPVYWWTNTAVAETKDTRVFASADEVLYMDTKNYGYGRCKMPELPILPNQDASYPLLFPYSNEYFFQTPADETLPWEAVVYPDFVFMECSSAVLRYRKMFCWGSQNGGRHWKDYLSLEGKGDYVEIQAGFSKTQRHGKIIKAKETIDFVQCFGGFQNEMNFYGNNWNKEKERIGIIVQNKMSKEEIGNILAECRKYAEVQPKDFLHFGSGYGALETERRKVMERKPVPEGLFFPKETLGTGQEPWLHLLAHGVYPKDSSNTCPVSYVVSKKWYPLLEQSIQKSPNKDALLQMSVYYMEHGLYEQAESVLTTSLKEGKSALAYRNLACLSLLKNQLKPAEHYYEEALAVCVSEEKPAYYAEYFKLLLKRNAYEKLFHTYEELPKEWKEEEHLFVPAVFAALELNLLSFVESAFQREYADIRENEVNLYQIWNRYHKQKLELESNTEIPMELIKQNYPIPYKFDFRTRSDI